MTYVHRTYIVQCCFLGRSGRLHRIRSGGLYTRRDAQEVAEKAAGEGTVTSWSRDGVYGVTRQPDGPLVASHCLLEDIRWDE